MRKPSNQLVQYCCAIEGRAQNKDKLNLNTYIIEVHERIGITKVIKIQTVRGSLKSWRYCNHTKDERIHLWYFKLSSTVVMMSYSKKRFKSRMKENAKACCKRKYVSCTAFVRKSWFRNSNTLFTLGQGPTSTKVNARVKDLLKTTFSIRSINRFPQTNRGSNQNALF